MSPTDRWLNSLNDVLMELVHPRLLESCGWFRFYRYDCPDLPSSVDVAVDAFLAIGLDERGNWRSIEAILQAVVVFLALDRQGIPTEQQVADVRGILAGAPVDKDAIRSWFDRVYPIPPGTHP